MGGMGMPMGGMSGFNRGMGMGSGMMGRTGSSMGWPGSSMRMGGMGTSMGTGMRGMGSMSGMSGMGGMGGMGSPRMMGLGQGNPFAMSTNVPSQTTTVSNGSGGEAPVLSSGDQIDSTFDPIFRNSSP